ncbi:MAG: TAXI family TRAP transporter solute-binding subunit [Syntrophaceae bacterium]|nr:TAXI family TRAP transporter solute-binding subunit [Syntrophaceae bacterium]
MRGKSFFIGVSICVIGLFFSLIPPDAEAQKQAPLRFGSSRAGSAGYVTLFGVAKIINDRAKDIYIEAVPTAGSIASQRMMGKGELEGCYSGTWNLIDLYQNRGPYEKSPYPAGGVKPYQTWYCYLVKLFAITRADRTDIKHWSDLAGKKVMVPIPGSAVFEIPKAALVSVGLWDKIKVVDIAYTAVPDALKMGTIDAAFGYVNGDILIPWMAETDSRVKIKVVMQSPKEAELIRTKAGVATGTLKTKKAFSQDVGAAEINTINDIYGFHIGKNLSTDKAYEMFKILIENAGEVAKVHAMLQEYAENPLGLNVNAIDSIAGVPVHPGVAKYLKEKGVWKQSWKIGPE